MTIIRGYKVSRRESPTPNNPTGIEYLVWLSNRVPGVVQQHPQLEFFGPAVSLHFAAANHIELDWFPSLIWPRPTMDGADGLLCWSRPKAGHGFSIPRYRIPIFSTNNHTRLAPLARHYRQTTKPISLVTDPTSLTKDELALWTLSESLENLNA